MEENQIEIYRTTDGSIELNVKLKNNTVWLTQNSWPPISHVQNLAAANGLQAHKPHQQGKQIAMPRHTVLFALAVFLFACSSPTVPTSDASSSSVQNAEHSSTGISSDTAPSSAEFTSSSSLEYAVLSSAEISYSSSSASEKVLTEQLLEAIGESGIYTTRDSVAAYLCKFNALPSNYRTKSEAQSLYEAAGNTFSKWNFNPWTVLSVMIGGDTFSNREELLPENSYRECDVDYHDSSRGTKRLVYAPGCQIFYTADHYESFSQIE